MMRKWICRELENDGIHAKTVLHINWSDKVPLLFPGDLRKYPNNF